ncbi:hypothetical protein, partial [Xanthobacter autotrophicus]|uniref:hypothetical protein n=1 Tax=Xanthobacter autotrophicus TaxID=280 RepID=UPI00372821A6
VTQRVAMGGFSRQLASDPTGRDGWLQPTARTSRGWGVFSQGSYIRPATSSDSKRHFAQCLQRAEPAASRCGFTIARMGWNLMRIRDFLRIHSQSVPDEIGPINGPISINSVISDRRTTRHSNSNM